MAEPRGTPLNPTQPDALDKFITDLNQAGSSYINDHPKKSLPWRLFSLHHRHEEAKWLRDLTLEKLTEQLQNTGAKRILFNAHRRTTKNENWPYGTNQFDRLLILTLSITAHNHKGDLASALNPIIKHAAKKSYENLFLGETLESHHANDKTRKNARLAAHRFKLVRPFRTQQKEGATDAHDCANMLYSLTPENIDTALQSERVLGMVRPFLAENRTEGEHMWRSEEDNDNHITTEKKIEILLLAIYCHTRENNTIDDNTLVCELIATFRLIRVAARSIGIAQYKQALHHQLVLPDQSLMNSIPKTIVKNIFIRDLLSRPTKPPVILNSAP